MIEGPTSFFGLAWKPDLSKLIVASVKPSSAAAEGKFQKDDVILKVEDIAVTTATVFDTEVKKFASGQKLKIAVQRQAEVMTLWLVVPPEPAEDIFEDHRWEKRADGLMSKDGSVYSGTRVSKHKNAELVKRCPFLPRCL